MSGISCHAHASRGIFRASVPFMHTFPCYISLNCGCIWVALQNYASDCLRNVIRWSSMLPMYQTPWNWTVWITYFWPLYYHCFANTVRYCVSHITYRISRGCSPAFHQRAAVPVKIRGWFRITKCVHDEILSVSPSFGSQLNLHILLLLCLSNTTLSWSHGHEARSGWMQTGVACAGQPSITLGFSLNWRWKV